MKKRPKKVKIKGKMWNIEWDSIPPENYGRGKRRVSIPILGLSDDLDEKDRTITINPHQSKHDHIRTLIHEWIHCYFGDNFSEKETEKQCVDLGNFLWKCGIRI